MKIQRLFSFPLIVFLSACSGNALMPKNNSEISVTSEPSAASVYVMGKLLGSTPMVVSVKAVYPVTYSQENTRNYGQITLKHKNCSDRIIAVNTRMVSDGIKAKLDCTGGDEDVVKEAPLAGKTVNQRLKELQRLKDEGLINEEEYREIRNRILQSL